MINRKLSLKDLAELSDFKFWNEFGHKTFLEIKEELGGKYTDEEISRALAKHSPNWKMWRHMSSKEKEDVITKIKEEFPGELTPEKMEKSIKEDDEYLQMKVNESFNNDLE